jgi:hypothetical protein
MGCSMTGIPIRDSSEGIWNDGEWISWQWINSQFYTQEPQEPCSPCERGSVEELVTMKAPHKKTVIKFI